MASEAEAESEPLSEGGLSAEVKQNQPIKTHILYISPEILQRQKGQIHNFISA